MNKYGWKTSSFSRVLQQTQSKVQEARVNGHRLPYPSETAQSSIVNGCMWKRGADDKRKLNERIETTNDSSTKHVENVVSGALDVDPDGRSRGIIAIGVLLRHKLPAIPSQHTAASDQPGLDCYLMSVMVRACLPSPKITALKGTGASSSSSSESISSKCNSLAGMF